MESWRDLRGGLNADMWGRLYKIVMAQLKAKAPPPNLSKDMAVKVLRELMQYRTIRS